MTRSNTATRALAVSLAALAGFVDATGFLATSGFFVSFMSGNSTQLGVGLAGLHPFAGAAGLVASFVAGAMAGEAIGRGAGRARRPVLLLGVAASLAGAAGVAATSASAALGLAALAMGAANSVFESDGEVRIGVTYMTGTLVKLGQRLAGALLGGPRWAWLPHLLLWLGLVCGAVLGSAAFPRFGLLSLWAAAAAALLLAAAATAVPSGGSGGRGAG